MTRSLNQLEKKLKMNNSEKLNKILDNLKMAAEILDNSDRIIVTSGAGMSVDCGMPDFRGKNGFWNAYPKYKELGLNFYDLAQPRWFEEDPHLAWGFYGHRKNMYQTCVPHFGYEFLKKLSLKKDMFFITSNVDGVFERSGIEKSKIWEIHGSIHNFQYVNSQWYNGDDHPSNEIFSSEGYDIEIDENMRIKELPKKDGLLLRPNILMFGDYSWSQKEAQKQQKAFNSWEFNGSSKIAIVECGAGLAIPSIRMIGESLKYKYDTSLIRVNTEQYKCRNGVSIPVSCEKAFRIISDIMYSH